jgi:Uma2 family endonuclease
MTASLVPPNPMRVGNSPVVEAIARASILPLTIPQYQRMISENIVPEGSTVELLRGVIVRKNRSSPGEDPMGHSPLHRMIIALLTALTVKINSDSRHMQIQSPIACPPDGAPEPDAAVIRGNPREYASRLPGPGDVSCVIEASHSSLDRDREDKLPIYAAAGIPQYIILNLFSNTVEIHTDPDRQLQEYRTKVTRERHETITLVLPDGVLEIPAADVLP